MLTGLWIRRTWRGTWEAARKEGSLSFLNLGESRAGFSQWRPRPAAWASPRNVLACQFAGPPQTHQVNKYGGGAQRCVWTSSPGDSDARSIQALSFLQLAEQLTKAGTGSPNATSLAWVCYFLGLSGRKPRAFHPLSPFCKPAPWDHAATGEVGRPGAAQTPPPTMWRTVTFPIGFWTSSSHASSLVAHTSNGQLDVRRTGGREELSRGGK